MESCEGAILFLSLRAWDLSPLVEALLERVWMIMGMIGRICLFRRGCFGKFLDGCSCFLFSRTELVEHTIRCLDRQLGVDRPRPYRWNRRRPFIRRSSAIRRIHHSIALIMIFLVDLRRLQCQHHRVSPLDLSFQAHIFRLITLLLLFSTFLRIISDILSDQSRRGWERYFTLDLCRVLTSTFHSELRPSHQTRYPTWAQLDRSHQSSLIYLV